MDLEKQMGVERTEPTPPTQAEIESTPAFKAFSDAKKQEAKDYVMNAFGLEVNIEDLIVWRDDADWPDPLGRAGTHKLIVSNQKYRDAVGSTLGNYNIWRKLPVPASIVTETEAPVS